MIKQYIYGRKLQGYARLNEDYSDIDHDSQMKLEAMKAYNLDRDYDVDVNNLPLTYYAYTDIIAGEPVWIEGLTSFVPAGVCEESGLRDTSMLHKYVYSGDDYANKLKSPVDGAGKLFHRNIDEYKSGLGSVLSSEEVAITFEEACSRLGFTAAMVKDFIACMIDSFPCDTKRVYCFLRESSRECTLYARRFMEYILSKMPPAVNAGCGFVTYASTYANDTSNIMPGSISVVFIPPTEENKFSKAKRGSGYVFDPDNYKTQFNRYTESVDRYLDATIRSLFEGSSEQLQMMCDRFINRQIKFGKKVDIDFLGAVLAFSKRTSDFANGNYMAIADSIHALLRFQDSLTDSMLMDIRSAFDELLQRGPIDEKSLPYIDRVYTGGVLLKDYILEKLCYACDGYAAMDDKEALLAITQFEYEDEDLNGNIIDMIWRNPEFLTAGIMLIRAIFGPVLASGKLEALDKTKKILGVIKGRSAEHADFSKSEEFIIESTNAIMTAFNLEQGVYDMLGHLTFTDDKLIGMENGVRSRYVNMLHDMALKTFKEFVKSGEYITVDNNGFKSFAVLVDNYMLKEQETVENGENLYALYDAEFKLRKEQGVFAAMEPAFILQFLDSLAFGEAVDVCQRRMQEVRSLIWFDPEGDRTVQSALEKLFFYFFATCDEEIMTSIVNRIYTAGGLNGVRVFADRCPKNIPYAGMTREKVLAAVYTAIYTKKDELVEAVETESNTQKQRQLYEFLSDCGIIEKRRSLQRPLSAIDADAMRRRKLQEEIPVRSVTYANDRGSNYEMGQDFAMQGNNQQRYSGLQGDGNMVQGYRDYAPQNVQPQGMESMPQQNFSGVQPQSFGSMEMQGYGHNAQLKSMESMPLQDFSGVQPQGFGSMEMQQGYGNNMQPQGFGSMEMPQGYGNNMQPQGFGSMEMQQGYGNNMQPQGFGSMEMQQGYGNNMQPQSFGSMEPPQGYGNNMQPQGFGSMEPPQGYGNNMPPQSFRSMEPPQGYGNNMQPQSFGSMEPPQGYGNNMQPQGFGSMETQGFGNNAPPQSFEAGSVRDFQNLEYNTYNLMNDRYNNK